MSTYPSYRYDEAALLYHTMPWLSIYVKRKQIARLRKMSFDISILEQDPVVLAETEESFELELSRSIWLVDEHGRQIGNKVGLRNIWTYDPKAPWWKFWQRIHETKLEFQTISSALAELGASMDAIRHVVIYRNSEVTVYSIPHGIKLSRWIISESCRLDEEGVDHPIRISA